MAAINRDDLRLLMTQWRHDPGGTYQGWFLWDQRLKNFRSIRRGLTQVVAEIEANSFGNAYQGSSLQTVVGSIAEQRQLFKGADHAFLWKPKLRIPDIYEDRGNQQAFGRFLQTCHCCNECQGVLDAIRQLDQRQVKGLGPAVANLLYFLHPTWMPPFNTAMVKGYNALAGAKVKLGRWDQYIAMREGILRLNAEYRDLLSNDLGAMAGLLFDLGTKRYHLPPQDSGAARQQWMEDLAKVREISAASKAQEQSQLEDRTHTQIQQWLRDLGLALGYRVWVARNDRGRETQGGRLGDGCLATLPEGLVGAPGTDAIELIDVLWLSPAGDTAVAGFEVEHTTSIYSGIVRLLDLALSAGPDVPGLYLVAPDDREQKVREQLLRPAFSQIGKLSLKYLPYGELGQNRQAIARFSQGLKGIEAISRVLVR